MKIYEFRYNYHYDSLRFSVNFLIGLFHTTRVTLEYVQKLWNRIGKYDYKDTIKKKMIKNSL